MNLYDYLGVPRDASEEDIKKAYRLKASKLHPDREHGDEEAFKKVTSAYNILKDKDKRLEYDTTGRQGGALSREEIIDNMLAEMWMNMVSIHSYAKRNYFDMMYVELKGLIRMNKQASKELEAMIQGIEYHLANMWGSDCFLGLIEARLASKKTELEQLIFQREVFEGAKDRVMAFHYKGEVNEPDAQPSARSSSPGMNGFWS